MADSPALSNALFPVNDAFFTNVGFQGAFGAENWAAQWTALATGGYMKNEGFGVPEGMPVDPTPSGVLQITDADISRNTTWTANNQYVLNGLVFVEEGETLTIEPGTVIKGKPGQGAEASALVVARGGKIFAEGTAEAPIIFTAEADDVNDPEDFGSTDRGLWGGVIVLGRATLNSPSDSGSPITDNIEGIDINETRGRFGGNDDTDNSGVLRYISIRHGGTLIGADNEINGLTLGAVGSGTTLEFIEVFANLDDGIEFFGGTASVKFASVSYCGDDSFDYDQGWRGKGQFWFTIQDGDSGDGGEHDGDIDDNTRLPIAKPTIYNATFIGGGVDSGNGKRAFHIRDNAGAEYYNSIFTDFNGRAVDVADDSLARAQAGDVDFRNNLFWAFGAGDSATTIANANATFLFTETDRLNQIADPKLTGISRDYDEVLDPRPMADSPALSNALFALPADGFFLEADYQGAFGGWNWIAGWTGLSAGGYVSAEEGTIPSINFAGGIIAMENFEGLTLGPNVDEALEGTQVWTKQAPEGWTIDDSGVPGVGNPALDGVTEWAGWSFASKDWWVEAAGDQRRSEFVFGQGTVAIADGDEWDDQEHAEGYVDTFLSWPVNVAGVEADTLELTFASSWRPEYDSNYRQTANIMVAFDGGQGTEILRWESDSNSAYFHDHAPNEAITVQIPNPANANQMVITFGYFDAGNDWWWAIDNLVVKTVTKTVQPSISISRDGSNIVIEWEGVLQSAVDPRGPWEDVAEDSQSPLILAPGDQLPVQFGRAVAP